MKRLFLFFLVSLFLKTPLAAQQYDFSKVDKLLDDSASAIGGFGGKSSFILVKNGNIIYQHSTGKFSADSAIPIASATKWLSGALLMTFVDEGKLSLEDSVGKFIPLFKDKKAAMTIRQLFSHTSGLPGTSGFHTDRTLTLAEAVDSIALKTPLVANPGSAFVYGGASMQVAGRIVEIIGGKSWSELFKERIAVPLGLLKTDYTGLGVTENPQIGGGARSTAAEYARFLEMIMAGGVYNGKRILFESSVREMQKDQTNNALIAYTPYSNYEYLDASLPQTRYGIGQWRERVDAQTGAVLEVSSQGAFGFSPWIDNERGLIGVLSVRSDLGNVMPTYILLKQLIRAVIDGTTDVSENAAAPFSVSFQENPVREIGALKISIPESDVVQISVINALGLEMGDLKNISVHSGENLLTFPCTNYPVGIYFCRLATGDKTLIVPFVVSR